MKTLFLNPPSFQGYDGGAGSRYQAKREVRSFWYPTWLAQAAALVEDSRVVDAPADDLTLSDVMNIARDFELVIIYTSTPAFTNDSATASLIKNNNPQTIIGFVGPHVSILPEESLQAAADVDFVVRKEFEIPISRFVHGEPISEIESISWRDGSTIRHNPTAPLLTDLDSLPFVIDVYKRDLTIENYYNGYLLYPYLSIYGGRGCPARCTFCLWPQTISSHDYRVRSAESVYQELAKAKELFPQVKEFFLDDDTFTANPKRAIEIASKLKHLGITWSASSRANVSYETLKELKENGLRLLLVGFESGNDDILKNVRKGITTDMSRQFMRNCKSLGIATHGAFILGLPGETKETIEQTIAFARELDPYTIQVSVAAPYPGTELYKQAIDNGWLHKSALVAQDGTQTCVLSYDSLDSQEILASIDKFYRNFYFRPKVILRLCIQMLGNSEARKRRLREGREFFSYLRHTTVSNGNNG